ncbi:MAG: GNAT family N-acetyltransferase [Candidatus Zixiibacteriota bacterium]|nr:MAG: GNAT family N-acetyltransferase [candidate division Zixibacteria bacterium]
MIDFKQAESKAQITTVRSLFLEYAKWLNYRTCFEGFQAEVDGLPGDYGPPDGCLLLAYYEDKPAGCVAVRKVSDGVCEMRRLWVREKFRGKNVGWNLAEEIIKQAAKMGYKKMILETIPLMERAISIYQILGFKQTAVNKSGDDDVIHMELNL